MGPSVLHRFGANVRKRRSELGLSQERLAAKAGLHRNYVGGIERGERNVALINIVVLVHALDWSVEQLFEGVTEQPRRSVAVRELRR